MLLRGRVKNGVVVLENGAALAEGTLVEVRPTSSAESTGATVHVSQEQKEALLGLIGLWKVENPPNDEEVERIIEEYRMKKYG